MKSNLNVNISLPPSELVILKKIAKSLGWGVFVQQEETNANEVERQELVNKLYGCIQLPDDFDYKKELEQNIHNKYNITPPKKKNP